MAKIERVDFSNVSDALITLIKEHEKKVVKVMEDTCEEGIKESKTFIVNSMDTMKKGYKDKESKTKHYRSSFTLRKKNNLSRTLWNKQYQLSHLLENGHYVYNQYGGAYEIHPRTKKRRNKNKRSSGSKYGTRGYKTKDFRAWDKTEKHISKYVEDKLMEKLK